MDPLAATIWVTVPFRRGRMSLTPRMALGPSDGEADGSGLTGGLGQVSITGEQVREAPGRRRVSQIEVLQPAGLRLGRLLVVPGHHMHSMKDAEASPGVYERRSARWGRVY